MNNPANLSGRLSKIATFADGMFTDVFGPASTTPIQAVAVRNTHKADGTALKFQLWEVPGVTETATAFAQRVSDDITRLKPGVVELDIEKPDAVLAQYIRDTITAFRGLRATYIVRINIAPNKGAFLPVDLLESDPNLYVAEQTYYGDMSRVSESEVLSDLESHGVPASKDQVTYAAAVTTKVPDGNGGFSWRRVLGLPTIFYEGRVVAKLKSGLVFDDDLMAELGLL